MRKSPSRFILAAVQADRTIVRPDNISFRRRECSIQDVC